MTNRLANQKPLSHKYPVTPYQHKEANRYYWIVKGHLIPDAWSEKDILSVYDSYFDRIWGNHENVVHEDGFEAAYNKKFLTTTKS